MKIRVDLDKCIGSGSCEMLAPDVFEVSDEGLCQVLSTEASDEAEGRVRRAIESCPTRAISTVQESAD